ncbi:hypothetical protein ACFXPN_42715 [Streptomyces griseorubiginosus]|uniref:hypothetical protein n=1 Tax=Streptomyces griseorubiginosus TaxID=67304 RepID=UPI0036B5F1D4
MLKTLGANGGVFEGYGVTSEDETDGYSLFHVAVPVGGGDVEAESEFEFEEKVAPDALPVVTGAVGGPVVTGSRSVRPGSPVVAEEDGGLGELLGVPGGEDVHGVVVRVGSGS